MTRFVGDFLIVNHTTVVAIRYIESMTFSSTEDRTADVLKGDRSFTIVTASGREYKVVATHQAGYRIGYDLDSWSQSIYDKWKHIQGKFV